VLKLILPWQKYLFRFLFFQLQKSWTYLLFFTICSHLSIGHLKKEQGYLPAYIEKYIIEILNFALGGIVLPNFNMNYFLKFVNRTIYLPLDKLK